ncbi:MAG: hypothetical protein ABR875_00185 [Minisyncoccia bacterium]|jgi:hypothetical protein
MEKFETSLKQEKKSTFLTKGEVLQFSPQEMVDYLNSLDTKGGLEAYLESALEDDEIKANLSYWEKWMKKDQRALLDKIIEQKKEIYPPKSESLPLNLDDKFTEEELKLILSNLEAIQLTFGCSRGCPFCGFDAIKGVREHIPYSQLANLFQKYGGEISKKKPFLYWASEPSDYLSKEGLEDKTYEDVHQLAIRYSFYDPGITTSNVTDKKWMDFMNTRQSDDLETDRRFSVFGMSDERLGELKNRITTSRLEVHNEQKKVNYRTSMFGQQFKHVKGMGKTFEEEEGVEDIPKAGIACVDGILLTPRGLYNMFVVPITKEFPQGVIIIPLEKVTDEPINPGDNLREVMRRSIIEGRYSHEGAIKRGEEFQKYTGEFPKEVSVYTADKKFSLSVDTNGNVLEAKVVKENDKDISEINEANKLTG